MHALLSIKHILTATFISGKPSNDPLHPDFIPSKFLLNASADGEHRMERYQRSLNRVVVEGPSVQVEEPTNNDLPCTTTTTSVGTELSMQEIDALIVENASLKEQVAMLQREKQKTPRPELNDKNISFYTGLPSAQVFLTLLTYLTPAWTPTASTPLSAADQFLRPRLHGRKTHIFSCGLAFHLHEN